MADMATFRPLLPFPKGLIPSDCAAAHGLLLFIPEEPPRMDPSSMADRPDEARTDSSAASSIRRRMDVTQRKTPGSIGGGVALPGLGVGKGGAGGKAENGVLGESGGE